MNLLVISPKLERRKIRIQSFDWKFVLALVGNNYSLHVGYVGLVRNGCLHLIYMFGIMFFLSIYFLNHECTRYYQKLSKIIIASLLA